MHDIIAKKNGFSLVELLIGIAIIAILMAAVFGVFSSSLSAFRYNFTQTRNIEDARMAINKLADELRYATNITSGPANGETLDLADGNSLIYTVSVAGGNSSVERTLTRASSGTNAQTFILMGGTNPAFPSYQFGKGIVTALSIKRTEWPLEKKMQLTISITTNDTSYAGGKPLTTSMNVVPQNIDLP